MSHDAGTPPMRPAAWVLPNDWRRDEAPVVEVVFSEPVSSATLSFGGRTETGNCVAARCVFTARLWRPTLNGLTAQWPMTVTATDAYGNDIVAASLSTLSVTRQRWEVTLTGSQEVRAGLALDDNGALYVGSRTTGAAGSLTSFADTGAQRWTLPVGAVQSVAVDNANDEVFYAANLGTTGTVSAAKTDGGVSGIGGPCQSALNPVHAGLALLDGGAAVGVLNSNGATEGVWCRVKVGAIPNLRGANSDFGLDGGALDVATVPNQVESAANLLVDGTTAYIPTRNKEVVAIQNVATTPSVDPTKRIGLSSAGVAPWPLTGIAPSSNLATLAISGQGTIAALYLAAPGTPNATAADNTTSYGAAIYLGATAWAGAQAAPRLRRFTPTATDAAATTNWASASPLAGADRMGAAPRIYAVDASGQLTVVDDAMPSTAEWASDLGLGEVRAAPTLDCNRLNAASDTGVLYVGSITGKVASYIVDSPRLADSSWPKYQKDAANSGNTDKTAFPLNPGCPQ